MTRAQATNDDEDTAEDDEFAYSRGPSNWFPEVTEPQEAGVKLMRGGEFGRLSSKTDPKNSVAYVSKLLRKRGTRLRPLYKEDITSVRYRRALTLYTPPHWYFVATYPELQRSRSSSVRREHLCRPVLSW